MAKKLKRQMAAKAAESANVQAISGGAPAPSPAARVTPTPPTPAPVELPTPIQLSKGAEAAAVRAISGGSEAQVQQAIQTIQTETAPIPPKPKGVAGADWVFDGSQWVLQPIGGGTFSQARGGGLTPTPPPMQAAADAVYDIALKKLAEYNLNGIAEALKKAREAYPELEVNDLLFLVENDERYNQPFRDRFKANELRFKKGLQKLKASDYLKMEQDYKRIFSTYNLPMFSNQTQYDKLIAGDVDPEDVADRVVMAYDRVLGDNSTRNAFRQFYGSLTDSDIVSALLDPEQQIPALEKKVVAAEVGGQALKQGLSASLTSAEAMMTPEGKQVTGYTNVQRGTLGAQELAAQGVTQGSAAAGYERIAEQLPTAEKLSSIYAKRTEQVGQKVLEQSEILGLASAKRKQQQLAGMEEATFSGQAGTMRTSLGRRGKQGSF